MRRMRMSNEELLKEVTPEEKEAAEKVINTDRQTREKETLNQAFINRIKETQEVGNTGYAREVVLPIPAELVKEKEEVRTFLTNIGRIDRDEECGLSIEIESETMEGIALLNVVFTPTEDTDLDLIKEKLFT